MKELCNKLRNINTEPEVYPRLRIHNIALAEINIIFRRVRKAVTNCRKVAAVRRAHTRRLELAPSSGQSPRESCSQTDSIVRKDGSLNCWEKVSGGEERNNTADPSGVPARYPPCVLSSVPVKSQVTDSLTQERASVKKERNIEFQPKRLPSSVPDPQ